MKPQNAKEFKNIKYQTNELKKRVAYIREPLEGEAISSWLAGRLVGWLLEQTTKARDGQTNACWLEGVCDCVSMHLFKLLFYLRYTHTNTLTGNVAYL